MLTGLELDGVALRQEGQTPISVEKLTVSYDPVGMIRRGLVLSSLTLDEPTILLERDERGWNVSRFVRARPNASGKGGPRLTIETLDINNGRVIVKDRGVVQQDVRALNTRMRFAYQKPGLEFDIARLSGRSDRINLTKLAGDIRLENGGIHTNELTLETDRTHAVVSFDLEGGVEPRASRQLAAALHADPLSLPEVGVFLKPAAAMSLEPKIDVDAHGTLASLPMQVDLRSSQGAARGSLVGHFSGAHPTLEGTLDVQNVNLEKLVNKPAWRTDITGHTQFDWRFGRATASGPGEPMRVNFEFSGPQVQGFGYRAQNVRAEGVYDAPDLRFSASGAAYGASATTHGTVHVPAAGPVWYSLAGSFRNLDARRLPRELPVPPLATSAAGQYRFDANGSGWHASGTLADSTAEGAQFASGTVFSVEARNRSLRYSASGTVAALDPRRFSKPLDIAWLDDERFHGSLTGSFTFEGSGRTLDGLRLATTADLTDSSIGGAGFPHAAVSMTMVDRELNTTFSGTFQHLPGSMFTERPELRETRLNGSARASVRLALPAAGPVELKSVEGSTTLDSSTIAGVSLNRGEVSLSYDGAAAQIDTLSLSGPEVEATASGRLGLSGEAESSLKYDVAVTDLEPFAARFDTPVSGGAHIVGQATGPASALKMTGEAEANRLEYSTTVDALAINGTYSVTLPDWNLQEAAVQADTTATFVTLAGEEIPRVTARAAYRDSQLDFDTTFEQPTRSLGLGGRLLLHPDHHEVHLRALDLSVGGIRWSLPQGQEATAQYSPGSVTIESFVLQRGAQQITANGTVAIGDAAARTPNDLRLRMDNVQIRDINQLMLGQRQFDGLLNATASIRGTRSDPRIDADLRIQNGTVQGVGFESLTGTAAYEGRAATVDLRLQQNPSASLTAVGRVPVPGGLGDRTRTNEFDLQVQSSPIALALFQPATTQLTNLSGELEANLHVGGTIEAPRLDGQLNVAGAGFTVAPTAVTYSGALARLTFEGDRLLVDRFQISDEDHDQLVAIGQLGIVKRSLGEMNVQLSASAFKVLDNALGQVEVDADVRVTGDATKPQITGTVRSQNARLEVDQILAQLTKSAYKTQTTDALAEAPALAPASGAASGAAAASNPQAVETAPSAPARPAPPRAGAAANGASATPSLFDAATVDVRLRLPDDLVLRGRNMQTTYSRIGLGSMNIIVGGDLNIRKAPSGDPDIIGTVDVVRGYYEFQGRRFEVLRDSQIRFQGLRPVDPALEVGAQRLISGVTAIVNIRGTARQPLVTLSSQPPLDQADVLSLIVFNQPINQLGEGERVNLAQRAGTMAAGYIATPLANSIADALDLDLFEIRPEGGASGQPSVALGQQFGARLFVQFRQEFGAADRSELSFEYRINELLRLVSTVAQGVQQSHRTQRIDTTGADLLFVLSY